MESEGARIIFLAAQELLLEHWEAFKEIFYCQIIFISTV